MAQDVHTSSTSFNFFNHSILVPGELAKAFRLTINKVPYSIQKYKSQTKRQRDEYAESQIKL